MSDSILSTRMPRWAKKAIIWFWLTGLVVFYAVGVVSAMRSMLIVLFVSLFLSFAIEPAVNFLAERGIRRGYGTMVVFIVIIAGASAMITTVGTAFSTQVRDLANNATTYINTTQDWINDTFDQDIDFNTLRDEFVSGGGMQNLAERFADDVVNAGAAIGRALVHLVTVALFTFYLVAEGPKFRRFVLSVLQEEYRSMTLEVWDLAIEKTGEYIYTRAMLATISAVVHWLAFTLLDVPSPLALAIWVGVVSQFIPAVGTYVAGAVPVAIALLHNPLVGLFTLIAVAVYQQIENYGFAPRLTARTMSIHVTVAFGSVLVGIQLLGIVGAFLALPCAATVQALLSNWNSTRQRRHQQTRIAGGNKAEADSDSKASADADSSADAEAPAER